MQQDQIRKAAQDLLDALAIALPEVDRIIVMYIKRGGRYYGPNIRLQMDALKAALGATPEPVIPKEEHTYISTACYHGLHDRCRQSCKFCSTPCRCDCGHKAGNVEAPERRDADAVAAHSEHWRNPETGQVECECCCKWALNAALEAASSRSLRLTEVEMDDREFLEQHVGPCTASYINCGMADSYWAIRKDEDGQEFCRRYCGAMAGDSPAWAEARRILEARLKEIAEVEEEIGEIDPILYRLRGDEAYHGAGHKITMARRKSWERILAREQAALTELKRGLRPESRRERE